ncbi:hypothetical protein E5Z56_08580 [Ruminococcus bovis]|uniref:Transposase IS66 central domain-containing protein n=1 Tax=Ruminococcus bovis TaxID=2564099 RepID=A0A4P8XXF5_9FIRM|nr:hypothetical protein E5Z56_08580 [Ruminococcus bovis]
MRNDKQGRTSKLNSWNCFRLLQSAICNRKEIADKSYEEILKVRQEKSKPILDASLCWAEKQSIAFKSKLGGAFTYLKNNEKYLRRYLEDGRLEIDNNRAERSIKPL